MNQFFWSYSWPDYEETFAPVARYTSIRTVISLATQMGWEIHQMDVKTTFLNEVIEEVYIEQPEGFKTPEKKSHSVHGVEPKRAHWAAAKHVLGYLQGAIDYGLLYNKGKDIRLSGFTDADWVRSLVDRKSTSGYYFNIGSGITSWCSRKQKSVALSSFEAKYMATRTTSCEAVWLRKLLVNLFKRNMEVTRITWDNQSCMKLSKNPVFHDRSNHIDIRCHFVRDFVQRGAVQLSYTPTGERVANILTKALGKSKFDYFREKMGMVKNPF
eukprot:PITA_30839